MTTQYHIKIWLIGLTLVCSFFLSSLYFISIKIEQTLSDIRTITSEQRDAINCQTWQDDTCNNN